MAKIVYSFGLVNAAITALEDVGGENVVGGQVNEITFSLANTGQVLDALVLLVKPHKDSAFETWLSGSDWDTDGRIMRKQLGTIKTLASGATGMAFVVIGPVYSFKFQAGVAASTTSLVIVGSGV